MPKTIINPALAPLKWLAGTWAMELSNAPFLPDPKAVVRGSASFEWCEDGAYLLMRQGVKGRGTPWSTWLIGRDDEAERYVALYFDDRRVSRVYQMSLKAGVWSLWRESPGFSQRFVAKVSRDKKRIHGHWEKSTDGRSWEHDFDLTYRRR